MISSTLKQIILQGQPGLVITGAGISVASGLPTFRGPGGMYADTLPLFLKYEYFLQHPRDSWYGLLQLHADLNKPLEPNAGHHAIVQLQTMRVVDVVITQNVDGLHTQAGTHKLIELHGNFKRIKCTTCTTLTSVDSYSDLYDELLWTCASCGGISKPDVILFGEQIPEDAVAASLQAVDDCGFVLVVGTSGKVHPANFFIDRARGQGKPIIVVDPAAEGVEADCHLQGPCEAILPDFIRALMEN